MPEVIKVKAHLPNKYFTDVEFVEISIKSLGLDEKTNDILYRYDLPASLYDKLVDSEPKFKSYQNFLKLKEEKKKSHITSFNKEDEQYLQKYITSKLISDIISQISDLSYRAIAIGKRETLNRTKKIFVRFDSSIRHDRQDWTGGYMGEKVNMNFQFFIGYEVEEPEEKFLNENRALVKNYYTLIKHSTGSTAKMSTNFQEGNHLEPLHYRDNRSRNEFIYSFTIIDWTQEREDFFKNHILNKFKELDERLKDYFANLDNNKIEQLMSNSSQKLLG